MDAGDLITIRESHNLNLLGLLNLEEGRLEWFRDLGIRWRCPLHPDVTPPPDERRKVRELVDIIFDG